MEKGVEKVGKAAPRKDRSAFLNMRLVKYCSNKCFSVNPLKEREAVYHYSAGYLIMLNGDEPGKEFCTIIGQKDKVIYFLCHYMKLGCLACQLAC